MFTGIVEEVGNVKEAQTGRLWIAATRVLDDLSVGGSVSVSGACLTVTFCDNRSFAVDVVPETLRRTNLGLLENGDHVNLERPVLATGRIDGHIVQGHVDGTGVVEPVVDEGQEMLLKVHTAPSIMRYVVEKGFVSVDGTSLTVVNCESDAFMVAVIPYTRGNTVLGARKSGDIVNIEVDILAKYVERLLAAGSGGDVEV